MCLLWVEGFWLAFLLLPIIVLSFRKGNVAVILLVPLLFSDPTYALGWQDLWKTADQQASEALENGDAASAQSLFEDSQWRGSAAYKAGDYETAINEFIDFDHADGHYNRGNALAHSGDLDAAIEAYDQALALNPEMDDALANKELLEQLKQQQEQQQEQQDSDNSENSDSQDSQQQDSQQQDAQNPQSQDQQQSDRQNSEQQNPADQEPEPKDGESEKSEEQRQQEEAQRQEAQQKEAQKQEQTGEQAQEESEAEKQAQKELEQWLRRVPDDPGGLLREKFRYQSRQRALEQRRPAPPNNEQQERW